MPESELVVESTARSRRRIWTMAIGAMLGASFILPGATVQAPVAEAAAGPSRCGSGWSSTTKPPHSIRVLRRKTGRVTRVPFRKYVVTVMGKEWPSYLPQPVVEAGAVAVKQYGWYHTITRAHRSKRGQCFDVRDGVSDQLYKPNKARVRPDHHAAVSKTWNVRLLKNGRLFMTGYRRGAGVKCGRDHTGYKLYARSATKCAKKGYSYLEILRRYYGPNLDVVKGHGGPSEPAAFRSQSSQRASTASFSTEKRRLIDDRNRRIALRGSWWYTSAPNAVQRTLLRSTLAGSVAKLRFVGREVQLIGRVGPGRGKIDVFINGRKLARVDMSAARVKPQTVLFSRKWRHDRRRILRVVVVDTPNRSKVELDAILIR